MVKKKEVEVKELEEELKVPALTKEEYWQWRTTIAEMDLYNEKKKSSELIAQVLGKEAEIAQVKLKLHVASAVRAARDEAEAATAEYHSFKKTLEARLGLSLSGKAIDDVTFEVRELPKPINN